MEENQSTYSWGWLLTYGATTIKTDRLAELWAHKLHS
jgi:hypothetical protein